ncbi:hypothetical protein BCR32DRAFT_328528 [Anaeromyces robustus]|uniref:Uncharacterized protein n=1 Tax=Anaeromyces robustus TaxID=1754192 RepID=A0A1Y1WY20_9FUNG|nr:hypothetical protein BCR32DRAFT_328528 [Anaeromyces robustus]|eukprot:ORX78450.1 hypothetical protein BCR32DRAFT_328528 [Anaeromyces robustus]
MNFYRSAFFLVLSFLSLVIISVNATWTEGECLDEWTRRLSGEDVDRDNRNFTPSYRFIRAACEDKEVCRLGWTSWKDCCKRMCRKGDDYRRYRITDNQTGCTCFCNHQMKLFISLCKGRNDQDYSGSW